LKKGLGVHDAQPSTPDLNNEATLLDMYLIHLAHDSQLSKGGDMEGDERV
jgi:hypothetical protein